MARPHPALIEIAAARRVPRVTDSQALVRSAFEHKMGGLLWSRVLAGEVALDGDWHDVLLRHDLRNWARHARLQDGLLAVRSRLEALGVPSATAKGVTAEARWYGRMGERPCFDVDMLIGPESFGRIDDILDELAPAHPLRATARQLIAHDRLLSMNLNVGGLPVDLHFDMLKLDLLPSRQRARLWQHRVPYSLGGQVVEVLDAETSLIQLLLQLNKDSFAYLLGFADVARICERESLDWRFVDDFLRLEGLQTQLYSTLSVVTETLRIVPVAARAPGGWRRAVWRIVWRPANRLQGDAGIIRSQRRNWWLPLTARGRGPEAIRAVGARLFPPLAILDYFYPGTRGPYLWRLASGRLAGAISRRRLAGRIGELGASRIARASRPPRQQP